MRMLRNGLCVVVALTLSAGTLSAAGSPPEVSIQGWGFVPNTFYVDLGISDFGDLAGQDLGGIAAGCTLSGSGIGHLQTNAPGMRLTGAQWAALVSPKSFAWSSFSSMSTAASLGGVDELTTFAMFNESLLAVPVDSGDVVCRFLYAWDNILPEEGSITIHISGDVGEPLPYLLNESFQEVTAGVANNDLSVPEPATLTLVAMGLAGLLTRRRKA